MLRGTTLGSMTSTGSAWHLVVSDGTGRVQFLDRSLGRLGSVAVGPTYPSGHGVLTAASPAGDVAVGLTTPSARPVVLVDGVRQRLSPVHLGGFPSAPSRALAIDLAQDRRHLVALLATGAAVTAYVWDLRVPGHPHRFPVPEGPQGVAISPDGPRQCSRPGRRRRTTPAPAR